jgi:hypothetical protein
MALTIWHGAAEAFVSTRPAWMKFRVLIVVTLVIGAASATNPVNAASCSTKKHANCLRLPATVNFSSVPDISKQIVSEEPVPAKPTTSTLEAPPITTYTGPTAGFSSMARAPVIGYYWSLEPQTDTH